MAAQAWPLEVLRGGQGDVQSVLELGSRGKSLCWISDVRIEPERDTLLPRVHLEFFLA